MRIKENCRWLISLALLFMGTAWGITQGRLSSQMVMVEDDFELISENGRRAQNKLGSKSSFNENEIEDLIRPFQSHFNQQQTAVLNQMRNETDVNSTATEIAASSEPPRKQTIVALKGSQNELITNEDGEVYLVRVDPITKETTMMNMSKIKDIDFLNAKLTLDTGPNAKPPIEKYSISKYEPFQWYRVLSEGAQPNRRGGHSLTIVGQTVVLFGGCHLDMECYNELFFYDIMSKEWTQPKTIGEPPSVRGGHSATLIGQYIYIYGGASDHGVLSDIHRFNLESRLWEQFEYEGEKPGGRTNHKAIIDNSGRIVIFGGYTNKGYSNEVYFLDLVNMRWVKPMVNGEPPLGRENFSMNLVRESYIWVFGGYALGGETNDLWQLDVEMLKWTRIFASYGSKPIERQGHQMILHGKLLFTVGGCNYKQQRCFNDLYQLHTDDLTWTKLDFPLENELKPRDNFGISLMGSNLYLFGGCEMMQNCYNDFSVMNITDICPRNCSGRGTCRNSRCSCDQGFQGEECEVRLLCEANCLNRGFCGSDARCHCYPGYSGNICQIYVPCPSNCTSIASGRCDVSGKCMCTEGNSGDACEVGQDGLVPIKTVCPNECSHHGICNESTGICICEEGYGDFDCSLTEEIKKERKEQAQKAAEEAEKNRLKELQAIGNNTNSTSTESALNKVHGLNYTETSEELTNEQLTGNHTEIVVNSNSNSTDVEQLKVIGEEENESEEIEAKISESSQTPTESEGVISDRIAEFIHSQMQKTASMTGKQDEKSSNIEDISKCENSCTFNGVCISGECFCKPGVTGEDCSVFKISQLSEGQKIIKLLFFGPLFFIIGIALGYLYIKQLKVKQELQEFGEIKTYGKKEEQDESIHETHKKNAMNRRETTGKGVEDGSEVDSFSQDLLEEISEHEASVDSLEHFPSQIDHQNQKQVDTSNNNNTNRTILSKEINILNDD